MPLPFARLHLPLAPHGVGLVESAKLGEASESGTSSNKGQALAVEGLEAVVKAEALAAERAEPADESEGPLWQVGGLAKAAGKTVRAIHLYEELGLLRPHARSKGRYRLFGPEALVRVRLIAKLQELGLSLGEIQGVVRSWEAAPSAPGAMRGVREVYRAKLSETREQIARLTVLEAELSASLSYLETCDSGCEPARGREACPSCQVQSTNVRGAPELVAGFHAGYVPPPAGSGPVASVAPVAPVVQIGAAGAVRAAAARAPGGRDDALRLSHGREAAHLHGLQRHDPRRPAGDRGDGALFLRDFRQRRESQPRLRLEGRRGGRGLA